MSNEYVCLSARISRKLQGRAHFDKFYVHVDCDRESVTVARITAK